MCGDIVVQVSTGKIIFTGKAYFDQTKPINTQIYNVTVPIESIEQPTPADVVPIVDTPDVMPKPAPILYTPDVAPIMPPVVMPSHTSYGEHIDPLSNMRTTSLLDSVTPLVTEPTGTDQYASTPVLGDGTLEDSTSRASTVPMTDRSVSDSRAARRRDPAFNRGTKDALDAGIPFTTLLDPNG